MQQNTYGDRGGNISLSKAGLRQAQITGHYNEFEVVNKVYYSADGVIGNLGVIDNVNAAYTGATVTLPSNKTVDACNVAIFAIWVASGNVVSMTRGQEVDVTKLTGTGRTAEKVIPFPDVEASKALVGLIKVVTNTAFTFGTTNFNAAGVTTTFYDCSQMPTVPLTS